MHKYQLDTMCMLCVIRILGSNIADIANKYVGRTRRGRRTTESFCHQLYSLTNRVKAIRQRQSISKGSNSNYNKTDHIMQSLNILDSAMTIAIALLLFMSLVSPCY